MKKFMNFMAFAMVVSTMSLFVSCGEDEVVHAAPTVTLSVPGQVGDSLIINLEKGVTSATVAFTYSVNAEAGISTVYEVEGANSNKAVVTAGAVTYQGSISETKQVGTYTYTVEVKDMDGKSANATIVVKIIGVVLRTTIFDPATFDLNTYPSVFGNFQIVTVGTTKFLEVTLGGGTAPNGWENKCFYTGSPFVFPVDTNDFNMWKCKTQYTLSQAHKDAQVKYSDFTYCLRIGEATGVKIDDGEWTKNIDCFSEIVVDNTTWDGSMVEVEGKLTAEHPKAVEAGGDGVELVQMQNIEFINFYSYSWSLVPEGPLSGDVILVSKIEAFHN